MSAMNRIILFDGDCNFCDRSVQFIIKRDPEGHFRFASLQSKAGQNLLLKHNIPQTIDSFLLIENDQWYIKSSAALRVCKKLKGFWTFFQILLIVPRPVRDFFYEIFAKNRYKWFGKRDHCMLPSPEMRKRFLS